VGAETFAQKITASRQPQPQEIIYWMKMANPFKDEAETPHPVKVIVAAG
jgi:hypothetical protein